MVRCDVSVASPRPSYPARRLSMGLAGPILLAGGWVLMGHAPIGPLWTAALRVLAAGMLLLASAPGRPRGGQWWLRTFTLGLVNVGGFFGLQAMSIQLAPMGIAATVTATQVLVVPVVACVVAGVRLHARQLCVGATGVMGVGLLVLHPHGATDRDTGGDSVEDTMGTAVGLVDGSLGGVDISLLGVVVAAGAAVCSAVGLVLTGHWGVPEGTSAMSMTGWQLVVGGVVLVPLALVVEDGLPAMSGSMVAVVAALAASTAAAFGLMFSALHAGLPAVLVSRLMLMIPLLVTAAGWVVYGQMLSVVQGVGFVVVLGSIAALTLSAPARSVPEPSPVPAERE